MEKTHLQPRQRKLERKLHLGIVMASNWSPLRSNNKRPNAVVVGVRLGTILSVFERSAVEFLGRANAATIAVRYVVSTVRAIISSCFVYRNMLDMPALLIDPRKPLECVFSLFVSRPLLATGASLQGPIAKHD